MKEVLANFLSKNKDGMENSMPRKVPSWTPCTEKCKPPV